MFQPNALPQERAEGSAFGGLSLPLWLRSHLGDRWIVTLLLAASALVSLGAGYVAVERTVDALMRASAEREACEWASSLAQRLPDVSTQLQAPLSPDARRTLVAGVPPTGRIFLVKAFDKDGNLIFASNATADNGEPLKAHNPVAARTALKGKLHASFVRSTKRTDRPAQYSEAYVPIIRDGNVVAVIEAYVDQTAAYRAHGEYGVALSLTVAVIIVLAFGPPAAFGVVRSRQKSQTEARLRISTQRLLGAIDAIPHGLSIFDASDRLVACNKRYREMYALPPDLSRPGTAIADILAHGVRAGMIKDPTRLVALIQSHKEARTPLRDCNWEILDGRIISMSIDPLEDGGRIAVHRDVTGEFRNAARIAESEARFRDFASSASDWCWETDAEHRFTYLTEGFEVATGLDPSVALGMRREDVPVHPDDLPAIAEHARVLARHEPFRDFVIRVRMPSGKHASMKSSGNPRFGADGKFLGYRGTSRDITAAEAHKAELSKAEEALRLRTQALVEAQRLGRIGDWSYTLGADHQDWGPELYELLRYERGAKPISHAFVIGNYVGDGFERVLRSHREIIGTSASRTVDVKFRRGDGVVIDCAVTSKAVYGKDGRIIGFSGTIQDITERKLAETQLEALAYYDPLTGLANRALFTRQLEDVLSDPGRGTHTSALLLLDLDRFKEVNDSLGHSSGDELLVKVGNAISRLLDSHHFLARLGGDEFAVIVRGAADRAAIEGLAQRIIAAISGSMLLEHGEVAISTSIGIALIEPGKTATELLRNADLALYTAKAEGRARFAMFRPEMDEAVQNKMVMARELRRALVDGAGLSVHYQPQVDLRTGHVVSYEALMRWTHPVLGSVPPDEFIPIAESSHLIVDLGLWILREAAVQIARWQDAGLPERPVAVNISAAQIWHSDLVTDVAEILRATDIRPNLLCLELTESLLVDHAEARARTVLGKLAALGVSLALDDFGTDYSSLGYLTQLPFDKLKIDRIFISGIAQSARARELLKGIIALGHGLGMTVVAEGAEEQEQIDILVGFGCDLVQGFGITRPVPADEASAFAESFRMANPGNAVHAMHARIASGF
jgi:diguanylate cyclase (GGDEF)-like protein/PAS domain S-box-containing protein